MKISGVLIWNYESSIRKRSKASHCTQKQKAIEKGHSGSRGLKRLGPGLKRAGELEAKDREAEK
jgi:hypothetical protein